ncbi:JM120 [macacine gammaherpesvirus 11]|uniref:JM120 n=2 Tax=macacine gammaherpesvirus 11 TaxID=2560570 RepID=G9JMU8_9GAMA|nr:JM120 [Macaca fuscata rhadinovirus]AAT00097.1 JM120 [Macaca fuscata rhadinovirus]AEW87645.1 JM120 [Macaca fuscata rhadinovirus]AEW87815.1 JM120 [Macaca fuscata rhadinovirus]
MTPWRPQLLLSMRAFWAGRRLPRALGAARRNDQWALASKDWPTCLPNSALATLTPRAPSWTWRFFRQCILRRCTRVTRLFYLARGLRFMDGSGVDWLRVCFTGKRGTALSRPTRPWKDGSSWGAASPSMEFSTASFWR